MSSIEEFLGDHIQTFLTTYPKVSVEIEAHISTEVTEAVADARADFGICRHLVDVADLQVIPYRADHLVMAVPAAHRLAESPRIKFSETRQYPHIGLLSNGAVNRFMGRIATRNGLILLFKLQLPYIHSAVSAIANSLGISILPAEAPSVIDAVEGGRIKIIPLSEEWATRSFIICHRRRQELSKATKRLVDHLTANNVSMDMRHLVS